MQLRSVSLRGWRNLAPVTLELDGRLNVFVGQNAQGKTNLVEAIDFLATLRSFRSRRPEELVGFGESQAELHALLVRRGLDHQLDIELRPPQRRVHVSGKPMRTASAYVSLIGSTLFVPDDLLLVRGSPSLRRRFIDRVVFSLVPSYVSEVREFERVLKQRNAALRQGAPALVEAFDTPFVTAAARLVVRRCQAIRALEPALRRTFAEIMVMPVEVGLSYRPVDWLGHEQRRAPAAAEPDASGSGVAELGTRDLGEVGAVERAADGVGAAAGGAEWLAARLLERLREERPRDLARGHTGVGPQADDVDFFLDGRLVRVHASQGQTRAFVLALKLAEIAAFREHWSDEPLLLLDDVASELDEQRIGFLFDHLAKLEGQVFLTTTNLELVPWPGTGRRWRVTGGRYEPL